MPWRTHGDNNMHYEVQMNFLCGGWANCWTVDNKPSTFNSYQEALAEIKETIADCSEEGMEGYSIDEFRIVKVTGDTYEVYEIPSDQT